MGLLYALEINKYKSCKFPAQRVWFWRFNGFILDASSSTCSDNLWDLEQLKLAIVETGENWIDTQ